MKAKTRIVIVGVVTTVGVLPDEGVEPILCVPFPEDYMVNRIPVMPPCTPTPPPEP